MASGVKIADGRVLTAELKRRGERTELDHRGSHRCHGGERHDLRAERVELMRPPQRRRRAGTDRCSAGPRGPDGNGVSVSADGEYESDVVAVSNVPAHGDRRNRDEGSRATASPRSTTAAVPAPTTACRVHGGPKHPPDLTGDRPHDEGEDSHQRNHPTDDAERAEVAQPQPHRRCDQVARNRMQPTPYQRIQRCSGKAYVTLRERKDRASNRRPSAMASRRRSCDW